MAIRPLLCCAAVLLAPALAPGQDTNYWTEHLHGLAQARAAYPKGRLAGARGVLIASKLLAASHYFNASLEIMAGVPAPDGKGLYLLSLYRTRLDPPTGMLAGVLMGRVRDGVETGVKENLKTARERLAVAR